MSQHSSSGGSGPVWERILDLLTSLAAAAAYAVRRLADWLRQLEPRQRRLVLALTLAAAILLAVGGPRLAPSRSGSSSSGTSDRVSSSRRTCLTCLGSGKCRDCGGSGYGYVRGSGGDRIKTGCNTCHGSGDCKNSQCKNGMVPFR